MAVEYVRLHSKWTATKPSPYKGLSWPIGETVKVIDISTTSVTFCLASTKFGLKQQWTIDRNRFLDCFVEVFTQGHDL